ncbi:hypothetical protein [Erythrobacter crassostreae]|uniref:Uncharacterized protein n=1 Tax=Erythrobacter crassostreae TaxID=2828328 RepID=A0A9X1F462_9SPHN|nr:hypothetical protein [Erythrobacter crassostrea]MBV7259641.1 hypothetical protein [Erythrobacter crassostrea]
MIAESLLLAMAPVQTSALSEISAADLNTLCSFEGGPAGPFGDAVIEAKPIAENEYSTMTWALDPPIGPLKRFERWAQPYGTIVNTLRYEGDTSHSFDADTLAAHLRTIAEPAGWTKFEHEDPLIEKAAGHRLFKDVTVNGEETRLWLLADGGSETTSLYCQREDLMGMPLIKRWERYAKYRREPEAREASD